MLPNCPICGKPMKITQMRCEEDNVTVSGAFEVPPYAFLNKEDYKFIILFLRTKGNLKQMERITGIGYFTLRARLDKVLEKMGLTPIEDSQESEDVFRLVREGKITVDEALEILKKRKEGSGEDERSEENS